jgi:LacI family transcriptional regulator
MTSGRPPTLDDVARAAGVHKATASRALNPATRHQVSAPTAHRVSLEATRLGYVPNTLARDLRTSRTAAVGVLIPDLTNPLFPPIVRGIQDRLEHHGYTALLVNTDADEARERAEFHALRSRRVEGFIVATARRRHPLLEFAVRERITLVTVNRFTELPAVPAVLGDDADGVAQAVAHLRALGHTRLAHLAGPEALSTGYVRLRAFRAAAPGPPSWSARATRRPPDTTLPGCSSNGTRTPPRSSRATTSSPSAPCARSRAWAAAARRTCPSSASTTCRSRTASGRR